MCILILMRYAQYSTTVVYYPNHTEEQQTQPIPNPYSIHSKAGHGACPRRACRSISLHQVRASIIMQYGRVSIIITRAVVFVELMPTPPSN